MIIMFFTLGIVVGIVVTVFTWSQTEFSASFKLQDKEYKFKNLKGKRLLEFDRKIKALQEEYCDK